MVNGERVYVDLWPEKLDIEDRVYRPFIYGLLDLGGKLAQIGNEEKLENNVYWPALRTLSFAGAVVSKLLGDVLDTIAAGINHTILAMKHYTETIRVGNALTDTVGGAADKAAEAVNRTLLRSHPHAHHYTGTLAGWWNGMTAAVRRVTHTMSYGLLLFGLGLCVMLVYLLMY